MNGPLTTLHIIQLSITVIACLVSGLYVDNYVSLMLTCVRFFACLFLAIFPLQLEEKGVSFALSETATMRFIIKTSLTHKKQHSNSLLYKYVGTWPYCISRSNVCFTFWSCNGLFVEIIQWCCSDLLWNCATYTYS